MKWPLFFLPFLLLAHIDPYLKKALDKSGNHSLRNIDFIYMINLDARPEKFELSCQQLGLYGIEPYRFSAVNGWELTLEAVDDLGVRFSPGMEGGFWATRYRPKEGEENFFNEVLVKCSNPFCPCNRSFIWHHEPIQHYGLTYFAHCSSLGMIGIALSHLSVLQDALDSGYQTIWVMEDDIEVIRNPNILPDLIDKLDDLVGKEGWDILFTDQDIKNGAGEYVSCYYYAKRPNYTPPDPQKFATRYEISPDFRYVGSRYGGQSMIIRRSGMQKIIDFIKKYQIFLPYDMDYVLPPGIRLYTVTSDVVATLPKNISDNGLPKYLNSHPQEFR